jgi:hypothetical protein
LRSKNRPAVVSFPSAFASASATHVLLTPKTAKFVGETITVKGSGWGAGSTVTATIVS